MRRFFIYTFYIFIKSRTSRGGGGVYDFGLRRTSGVEGVLKIPNFAGRPLWRAPKKKVLRDAQKMPYI